MIGFNPTTIGIGFLAISAVVLGAEWHGRSVAAANAKIEAAVETSRILKKRGVLDDEVPTRDAAALCRSYGLSDDQISECMRRVAEADTESGDGGNDNPQ